MVDHPVDGQPTFGTAREPPDGARPLERLGDWLSGVRARHHSGAMPSLTLVAVMVSLVWLGALGAYGVGLLRRMSDAQAGTEGAIQLLPTLDILFFAFAVAGPLAMLWTVVLVLRRADRMSDALVAQGDSALALAATITNLNDSIDELTTGTLARLEGLPARVDKVMLESTMLVDRRVGERIDKLTETLEQGAVGLDRRLESDFARLNEAVGIEREALATLRDGLTRRLEKGLSDSIGRLEAGLDETRQRVDAALADAMTTQTAGLAEGDALVREGLHKLSSDVAEGLNLQIAALEAQVAKPMQGMQARVEASAGFIASNPPPSAETLAALLGDAAEERIGSERQALAEAIDRISRIEAKADALLEQIDRTSRLNPLMGPAAQDHLAKPVDDTGTELPFDDLPKVAARTALDWTAVVRVLDGASARGPDRQALADAAADPDVAGVVKLASTVASILGEERVFVADVRPNLVSASVWAAFADGAEAAQTAAIGATVEDDVVLALTRSRLRNDPDFHAVSLRLIAAYGDLVSRAVAEIGPDPRLVEMSDTLPGRVVQLLLCILRPFDTAS